jgi:hypothetical protein
LLSVARLFLSGRDARRKEGHIRELEAELKNLRSLPLQAVPPPAGPAGKTDAR